jgi:hypothetical protein
MLIDPSQSTIGRDEESAVLRRNIPADDNSMQWAGETNLL